LLDAPLERAGVMPARAETIRRLAGATASGAIAFDRSLNQATAIAQLGALPGIGDWTMQYVAMRAFNDGDAFPSGDLILRRAAGGCTARLLARRAEAWRPWRAYAVMLLWRTYAPPLHRPAKTGK
jgi:AraC family transcriptional regulator of adaptative response / DNA-3-methyladenine glycosylase II